MISFNKSEDNIFFWNDEIKKWNPTNYGGIFATKLPIMKTWIPMIAIRNGVGGSSFYKLNDLDIQKSTVVYNSVGDAFLIISGLYDVTCTSDVTYYPFDKHTCSILILSSDLLSFQKNMYEPENDNVPDTSL
jgi:hypothetical protein